MVDQLKVFVQVSALIMLHNLCLRYGTIDKIGLEENSVKMMRPYNPVEPLA